MKVLDALYQKGRTWLLPMFDIW